jgi:hypothetical protein
LFEQENFMSKIIIGLCAFVMLAMTPSVRADPIVITSGSVSLVGAFFGTTYSLNGQNFSISGGGDGGFSAARNCTPCLGGSTLGVNTVIIGNGLGSATVTINGTTFPALSILGTLQLSGGGFTIPAALTNITLTSGFNLSASIFGCPGYAPPCTMDNAVFSTTLEGSGMATLQLVFSGLNANGDSLFFFQSLTYNFGASEVPEPMTITLLAAGLMSLGAKLSLSCNQKKTH